VGQHPEAVAVPALFVLMLVVYVLWHTRAFNCWRTHPPTVHAPPLLRRDVVDNDAAGAPDAAG